MELENTKHSSGVAKAGLTTGIIGSALGAINTLGGAGILTGVLGRGGAVPMGAVPYAMPYTVAPITTGCVCNEEIPATRNDIATTKELMDKDLQIAELNTEVKLRDSTIYTDSKSLELYKYIDGQLNAINSQLAAQAVNNRATKDSLQIVNERIGCVKNELEGKICCETKERRCADNTIVNYANATFYPKQVADVTTGTTTTPQTLYNPLPVDSCCC